MEIFIKVAQLVLSLSILVILHEMGHFIPAKLFKTRVEKFYLFFDPWFSLFKFKRGETTYGMGWVPLGGYVKISGMIDESMDKEQMKQAPQPYEFRSKKAWQRLIIMIGGVSVNIILAVVIYIFMLFIWGEEYLPNKSLKYGISVDSLAIEMGLQNGDKILLVGGNPVEDFGSIPATLLLDDVKNMTIDRNGVEMQIAVSEEVRRKFMKAEKNTFISPRIPVIVDSIPEESPNIKSGLAKGDQIIGINDSLFQFYDQFKTLAIQNKGKSVTIVALRSADTVRLSAVFNDQGQLGFFTRSPYKLLETSKREYSFFEAIPAGFAKTYEMSVSYFKQLAIIFSPSLKGYENVGGFITMGKIFPGVWNWQAFWSLTAFLSIMLALLNILPIPALDGGHVLFLLVEIITGRKPGEKFLTIAQYIGMFLLLSLILFANGNDIFKLFK